MDHGSARERQQGQVMVLFLLAIFAIIGMVGLVLDGGSVFAQRRDQQTAADLAAMAGAAAYLNATGTADQRVAYAESVATSGRDSQRLRRGDERCRHRVLGGRRVVLQRGDRRSGQAAPQQLCRDPRHDIMGRRCHSHRSIDVQANGARGAMPLLFNAEAFPGAVCNEAKAPCTPQVYQLPGTGSQDVPQDATQFNWTIFCTASGNPVQCELERCRRAHQRPRRQYRDLPRRRHRTAQRRHA